MNIPPGKKYLVIPVEQYERLQSQTRLTKIEPFETEAMRNAEHQMKNIWDQDDIPDDKKIKLFTKQMNDFKMYHDFLSKPKPILIKEEKTSLMKDEKQKMDILEDNDQKIDVKPKEKMSRNNENFINALPKSVRLKAQNLLDYLKMYPEKIDWNEHGEIIYKGETISDSHISNLLTDTLTKRKTAISPTFHSATFMKALADINVPITLIKNPKYLKLYEAYKINNKSSTKTKTIDWLSSTSPRR